VNAGERFLKIAVAWVEPLPRVVGRKRTDQDDPYARPATMRTDGKVKAAQRRTKINIGNQEILRTYSIQQTKSLLRIASLHNVVTCVRKNLS
jgi:hypothetical protein